MRRHKLIARRKELGITQADIAQVIGVDRSTYVRYETGLRTPSLDVAQKIAAVLGSSVDFLFAEDVPNRNKDGQAATRETA